MSLGRDDSGVPLKQTEADCEEGGDDEVPVRVEAQEGEEDVFAEKRDVQVVSPAVHLHFARVVVVRVRVSIEKRRVQRALEIYIRPS